MVRSSRQKLKRRFLIDSTLGLLEDVTHRPNDSVRSDFLRSWYPRQSNYKTTLRIKLRPFPPGEKSPDDQKLKNVKFLDKVKNILEMNYRHDLKHFCCWNHFPNSSASLWNFVFYELSDGFSRFSKNFIITAKRVKFQIMITSGSVIRKNTNLENISVATMLFSSFCRFFSYFFTYPPLWCKRWWCQIS